MPLETATYIHQLNSANPSGSDKVKDGDDHIRMIKATLKATFPGITSPLDVSITPAYLLGLAASGVPFGLMAPFSGTVAPAGWAICDGSTVARSDGSGTITVPDCRGRVVMGLPISGTPAALSGSTNKTVSTAAAGSHSHTVSEAAGQTISITGTVSDTALTEANLPSHRHLVAVNGNFTGAVTADNSIAGLSTSGGDSEYSLDATAQEPNIGRTSATGSGTPHGHTLSLSSATVAAHSHTLAADGAHGHSVTVDVTQPTIAFHIIIKV